MICESLRSRGFDLHTGLDGDQVNFTAFSNLAVLCIVNTDPSLLAMQDAGWLGKEPVQVEVLKGTTDSSAMRDFEGFLIATDLRGKVPKFNQLLTYGGKSRKIVSVDNNGDRWTITTIPANLSVNN